jgi:hypothetical protein
MAANKYPTSRADKRQGRFPLRVIILWRTGFIVSIATDPFLNTHVAEGETVTVAVGERTTRAGPLRHGGSPPSMKIPDPRGKNWVHRDPLVPIKVLTVRRREELLRLWAVAERGSAERSRSGPTPGRGSARAPGSRSAAARRRSNRPTQPSSARATSSSALLRALSHAH